MYANKEDRTHFQEELEAKGSLENFEIRLRRKDGSELDALITAVLRRDATGAISGYQSITRDITPLKEMQRTLEIQYQKETEARQAVEAELKRRIEFTRALVHELKTPLTPVMASSELLGELAKDELTGKLSRNIFSGAQRLNERVNELLDLARGEIGILKVSPEVVDPTLILRQVADDIVPLCQRKKLAFSAAIPEALPWVKVDEERLRQVLLNLLNNAIASTPEGGKITLRATTDDSSLIVDVEDTGVGIPADQQSHLFSPYYRTESDRQRFSGLGLGLSLSKIIIQLHGGQIWVKSEPGKGSTFSFSIPLPNPSMEDSR